MAEPDMTHTSAAALWGSAENEFYNLEDRLKMALKALNFYGKEFEKSEDLHHKTEYESNNDWQWLARSIVFDWVYYGLGEGKNHPTFSIEEVYVVWYCFTLGGWKALISTTISDGRYYEVTYDKNKKQVYLDTYRKTHNQAIDIKEN